MEWMPIDSAPRDGTLVLLYLGKPIDRLYSSPDAAKNYCIGYYGPAGPYHVHDAWHSVESREEVWGMGSEETGPMTDTFNIECSPTHWAWLPEPPKGD